MSKAKDAASPHANRKLDKNKPYGEIWGRDENIPANARYQQNGLYFDHQSNCLGGEYKPADVHDEKQDLQNVINQKDAEIAELQRRLAAQGGELPAGDPKPADPAAPAEPSEEELDRTAIVAQLKKLNVSFPKNATVKQLHAILQNEIDSQQS